MYIESEFALLEAQNEQLTRQNKTLVAALELARRALHPYFLDVDATYRVNLAWSEINKALAPYQEECTCLPDLPDGRVNGGRGGCCPVCEDEIYIGGE